MNDQQATPSGPWVCPLRVGSNMRSPVTGDPIPTVATCVRWQCMLWRVGVEQCAFAVSAGHLGSIAVGLANVANALEAIAGHLNEAGNAPYNEFPRLMKERER